MSDVLNFAGAAAVAAMLLGAGYAAQSDKPADEGHEFLVNYRGNGG